jgi:protein quaking
MRYSASERERYLAELLAERQKLAPFVQVLPFCTRLLNQEILRASSMPPNHNFVDAERIEHGSPLRLPGHPVNGQPMDLEGWSGMQTEHMGVLQASPMSWNGAPALAGTPVVKKLVRLDVPVDKYPNVRLDFFSASVTCLVCYVMS